MPAGDTYRASQLFLMGGTNRMQIDLWLRDDAGVGFATMAATLDATLGTNLAPLVSSDLHTNGIRFSDPVQRSLGGATVANATFSAGTDGSPSTPPTNAVVITLNTGRFGRGKSGRIFVPGLPEGIQTDGIVPPITLAAWQTAWDTINADLNAGGITWMVAPQVVPHTTPPTYGAPVPIVLLTAQSVLRVQKGREVGRGRFKKKKV